MSAVHPSQQRKSASSINESNNEDDKQTGRCHDRQADEQRFKHAPREARNSIQYCSRGVSFASKLLGSITSSLEIESHRIQSLGGLIREAKQPAQQMIGLNGAAPI